MYELLKKLDNIQILDELVKKGVLSITIATHKSIYEVYLLELKKDKKAQAITNTSIETKTPERAIYKIIKAMEQ